MKFKSQIKPKAKVFVGLSGGVDSAVSAALLKHAGHDVTGVFIKVWQPDWIECNEKEDRRDAMRVAAHLGIPFVTLDLEREYKKGVIDYMIAEYAAGRTPNPDVMCNREIKFGGFWKWAQKQGADYIATGHYARVVAGTDSYKLFAGSDPNKDQSYFLWTLTSADLEHVLFPVGDLLKPEVRRLAATFKLPNAEKKDSQGLCFIGKVDIKKFLARSVGENFEIREGVVLDTARKTIGTHPGALFFTLGERRGFTINHTSPHDEPYYVIAKDMKDNTITVTNKNVNTEKGPQKRENTSINRIAISHTNWIDEVPKPDEIIQIRTRYRERLIPARTHSQTAPDGSIDTIIETLEPPDFPAAGQSLVAYMGDECLGGGIIENNPVKNT